MSPPPQIAPVYRRVCSGFGPVGAGCKLGRCEPDEARVRSVGVVVCPPFLDDPASLIEVGQQVLSRHSSRRGPLKLSTKPSCIRLPNAISCHSIPSSSCLARIAIRGELGAVVVDDHAWASRLSMICSRTTRVSELSMTRPRHSRVKSSKTRNCRRWRAYALRSRATSTGSDPEGSSSVPNARLRSTTLAQAQPLLLVGPVQLLPIDPYPSNSSAGAAASLRSQFLQPGPQRAISFFQASPSVSTHPASTPPVT